MESRNLSIRLDSGSMEGLELIAERSMRTPSALARDWILERLATLSPAPIKHHPEEPPTTVGPLEALRNRYQPDDVVILLVGESAPAGGTFFYRGDSNLYRATREAFERALGPFDNDEEFLNRFRDMGFWLYDMVDEPVNRRPGRPRRGAVGEGVSRLRSRIEEFEPDFVIGVKTSLEGPVRQAAQLAKFPASRVLILPFPLYQWREEYVSELSKFLNPRLRAIKSSQASASGPGQPARMTLHEAMRVVLERDGGPTPARQLANRISSEALYTRRDGARPDYQQLLARAAKYPALFIVGPSGISLRTSQ